MLYEGHDQLEPHEKKHCIPVFDALITPVVFYGCQAWLPCTNMMTVICFCFFGFESLSDQYYSDFNLHFYFKSMHLILFVSLRAFFMLL